jgi:branched-chain amino acid transport system ATP-binding protein
MLAIHDLHTYYAEAHVLRGVSLQIEAGQVAALLGRNGAGKSTLVNSIVGFVPPRRGEIYFKGIAVTHRSSHVVAMAGMGLVPQGRRLFPNLTVRENILLAARPPIASTTGGQTRWTLALICELFPVLAERMHHRPGQLSGGEQQMVAIARALMTNPDLLLLDEPSEGLAPLLIREVGRVLRRLKEHGLAMLLVEQNLSLALGLADHVYVLHQGEVAFADSGESLRHRRDLVQRYLGI